uniref:Uncharacterized protein n=1 Tax=Pyrodinium bahamense TaxID=73915 RepID=A0A7S0A3N4_9DINO|mmetsp:Transcript_20633/g.56957  ORF Transcript_20633/g.56957 Transcript_20633/m.56957 type:complete len:309 (+) Transcript_20633:2-928(+)
MGQTLGWALNVNEYIFPPVPASYDETHELLVRFPSEAEEDIPAMLLPPADCTLCGPMAMTGHYVATCVIYFHANGCDIGDCLGDMETLRDGAFEGNAVVVAPEYSGYGLFSEFEPSVESIDLVARASWTYCRHGLGFRREQIVLCGRSIGTGPAACLAKARAAQGARKPAWSRPLGALVLLAPFTNIADVVQAHSNSLVASLVGPMWDVAELLREPGLRDVPLCVVHPRDDEVVPLQHGQAVLEGASAVPELKYGLWLRDASHNFTLEPEHALALGAFLCEHLPEAVAHSLLFTEGDAAATATDADSE